MGRTLTAIAALMLVSGLAGEVYPWDREPVGASILAQHNRAKKPAPPSATGIDRYYQRAAGINDALLPEGLRVTRWGGGAWEGAAAVITSECLRYDAGEFTRLFFTSPYARRIKELFVENGTDASRLVNLLKAHSAGGREIVSVFDEGYMILTDQDEKANYILPIGKGMRQKLFALSQ